MSATEILEAAKALPKEERAKLAEDMWEFVLNDGYDPALTSEEIAELDRRAEETLRNPGRRLCVNAVADDIRQHLSRQK